MDNSNKFIFDLSPEYFSFPNPNVDEILEKTKKLKKIIKEPFRKNISAGKNTYIYDAHTYHTKVPPEGIKELIEYYTEPGDVVLDPFCGSGMTGFAATSIGRKTILIDLSPAATFIAYNMNTPINSIMYAEKIRQILIEAESLEKKLYTTQCRKCGNETPILYMVWSYAMLCSHCKKEFVLWDVARDEKDTPKESKIKSEFDCPHCKEHLIKKRLKRTKIYPVTVGYKCCTKGPKEEVYPVNDYDLAKLKELDQQGVPQNLFYPKNKFPEGINTRQPINAGITTIDKAYTQRALWAMAYLWDKANSIEDQKLRLKLLFTITSLYKRVTVFSEFRFWGGSGNTANFNVPAIMNEQNVFKVFQRKARTIELYFEDESKSLFFQNMNEVNRDIRISTQSACHLHQIPDKSIDYVFTDPPFGGNINYSEMNFLWESWLQSHTDNTEEAIVNRVQNKSETDYAELLTSAFLEIHRVLKDGAWFTVMFHNSSAKIWKSLQLAIAKAGFEINGSQTFDKKHGTFKQFVAENAVGYDLVLHCRKSTIAQKPIKRIINKNEIKAFIQSELSNSETYKVEYLHVNRKSEFDYRKLYSKWLMEFIDKEVISADFSQFKKIADEILKNHEKDYQFETS